MPIILAMLICLSLHSRQAQAADKLPQRWLYLQTNLQVAENVGKAEGILRRAAKAGYNGVVLADYKLNILDRVPQHYFKHAEQFKSLCDELKLELIPTVAPIGYSDGLLAHNPNLAEGIPVKNAQFIWQDGKLRQRCPWATDSLGLQKVDGLLGGSFEGQKDNKKRGWELQDGPGTLSFIDTNEKHSGEQSLRWERANGGSDYVNARLASPVRVEPWQQFHLSVWIKTKNYDAAGDVKLFAMGADGRILSHSHLGVKRDQDWTEHHAVFNSLDNKSVRVYCGTWGLRGGQLWMDDLRLEETAFVNLLRRPGCPLKVVDSADGTVFEEGRDFAELRDPKLGRIPWDGNFDVYHEPPELKLLPGSRINKQRDLLVSYSHTATIYDNQVCCCLAEPEVFQLIEDQVRRVEKLFGPKTYFLSHDEIRVANWCDACRRDSRSAGQLLAENMRQCVATVRKVNSTAKLCVWSDMFDPHHNAVAEKFYLVNGDLTGSWEGLPKDMLIINWNSGKPDKSLPFFTERGHSQVLAGYYDSAPANIVKWLKAGTDTKSSVSGAMYTTWQNNFADVEAFAKHAWGE
jgi:hypothetical protein